MANRWGKSGNSDFIKILSSKIIMDRDCSHKIKRHLLPQGEKTALRLGENNSKRSNRQRFNLKNIQATPYSSIPEK